MKNLKTSALACAAGATLALGASPYTHAATGLSTVTLQMTVNTPTCSITNSGATNQSGRVQLPSAGFATPVSTYVSASAFGVAGVQTGTWRTDTSLNQTATIACSVQNTYISSVIVQPGSSAVTVSGAPAQQYLVDGASVKAANGGLNLAFEQVSLNGTAAAYSYQTGSGGLQAYSNSATGSLLNTSTLNASTSKYEGYVVWRPVVGVVGGSSNTTPLGNPSGGKFTGSAAVVANF